MNCFFHPNSSAVSFCKKCNKGLCKSCASKYNPCLCDECFNNLKKSALIDTHSEFIATIFKGLISAIILTLLFRVLDKNTFDYSLSIIFFFFPFGWALITYIEQYLPTIFMSGPIFFIYLVFKFLFSILIGIPCFLFQVSKYIFKLYLNKK